MELIIVIVIGVVALGVYSSYKNIMSSVKAGSDAQEEFSRLYRSIYGVDPSSAVSESIRNISTTIVTHLNGGNESYGARKIEEDMQRYIREVGYNEEKIQVALAYLLKKCEGSNGQIVPRLKWVEECLLKVFFENCPNAVYRTLF